MQEFTKEELENEIWKDIPGFEGNYQVSDLGRVKSLSREVLGSKNSTYLINERFLKLQISKQGYYIITFRKNNEVKTYSVHQLVAICFLNHTPCGYKIEVNHKDRKRLNNRLSNLELLTRVEHSKHTHQNKTSSFRGVTWNKNDKKWVARVTIKAKTKYLGSFNVEMEAYEAVLKAEELAANGECSFMKLRDTTSKYRRVSFDKSKLKWRARITINGKLIHIGYFLTEIEAFNAVKDYK
jgi:hypothetical protein